MTNPGHLEFAEWLETALERIQPSDGRAAPGPDELLRLLGELDERTKGYHDEHGMEELNLAVYEWGVGRAPSVARLNLHRFRDQERFAGDIRQLGKRRPGSGKGLELFLHALRGTGVEPTVFTFDLLAFLDDTEKL